MIPTIKADDFKIEDFRFPAPDSRISRQVEKIIQSVYREGDSALAAWTCRFDCPGFEISDIPFSKNKVNTNGISKKLLQSLQGASQNIRTFSKHQLPKSWQIKGNDGAIVGERILPIERVGIYIPGGKAPYASTVLMTAIPAAVAGVKEIVLVTPPANDKSIHPAILAAAEIAGVFEIYRAGGAQAIAALAYGTNTIKPVDKIVGPGNIYVQLAKKFVFGQVGIDSLAGPSEVVILADEFAKPEFVAWEILAQAEHDELAKSILVTDSSNLIEKIQTTLAEEIPKLERRGILKASLKTSGRIILVNSLEEGIKIVNKLAPEHVSVQTQNAEEVAGNIYNGGAVFVGSFSPVALGDYWAGPSHVLPTSRTARFASPLGVCEFLKRSSWIQYSESKIRREAEKIEILAEAEGLTAHAGSIKIRSRRSFHQ
ncbi:histidinol dehydrogenase [bacterium BMS3Abin05]|nr:histidinol dehydrogenase [bacterium BMS3Abin05]